MSSLVNNALQTPADVVTLNRLRPSSVKSNASGGKEITGSGGTPITLPEDVVNLSPAIRGESATSTQKKPSVAVSHDEKQALLASKLTVKGFSVYG